jgi:hypothetical protein
MSPFPTFGLIEVKRFRERPNTTIGWAHFIPKGRCYMGIVETPPDDSVSSIYRTYTRNITLCCFIIDQYSIGQKRNESRRFRRVSFPTNILPRDFVFRAVLRSNAGFLTFGHMYTYVLVYGVKKIMPLRYLKGQRLPTQFLGGHRGFIAPSALNFALMLGL